MCVMFNSSFVVLCCCVVYLVWRANAEMISWVGLEFDDDDDDDDDNDNDDDDNNNTVW